MRKTAIALTLTAIFGTTCASADTLAGVYVGGQIWRTSTDASVGNEGTNASFTVDDESRGSVWVAFEHPVPVLPNLKLRYNRLDMDGFTRLTQNVVIGDEVFEAGADVTLKSDLDHLDVIFYYEVLDLDTAWLDVGINAKVGDFKIEATGVSETETYYADGSYNGAVPLLYAAGGVGLPFTGLGVFGELSGIAYSGNHLYDGQAGISWTFIDNVAIDVTAQLGYRVFKLKGDDLDDINAEIEFNGGFLGLQAHF